MTEPGIESPVDYTCRVCGAECDSAPEPPARAICEKCCVVNGGHDPIYNRDFRTWYCEHCGVEQTPDWGE